MSRKIARYGWRPSPSDHRDHIFNLQAPIKQAHEVPPTGGRDASTLPPIWNQLTIGSCTAHGALRTFLAEAIRQGLTLPMLARLAQYFWSRELEGSQGSDAGASVRDAIKVLATIGAVPESDYAYDVSKVLDAPPDSLRQAAKQHMAFQYQQILVGPPGAPMRTALNQGLVIDFGFPVPQYFEEGPWDPTSGEPLPLPGPNDHYIGGHCVAATRYDFSCKFVSTPSTNRRMPPFFVCDNSWDKSWGMAGRFNIAAEWFTPGRQLASDLWVIQAVK